MTEKEFFDQLELLLKNAPEEDRVKIISAWKEKWASAKSEKDTESFLTPNKIAYYYFVLQQDTIPEPSTCELHPSLQMGEEKKEEQIPNDDEKKEELIAEDNEKQDSKPIEEPITESEKEPISDDKEETLTKEKDSVELEETNEKDTQEPQKEEKKKKFRKPWILIVSFPLWFLVLGPFFLITVLFTVGYSAVFLIAATSILYALFTFVGAVFQGINAHIFSALFQGGIAILLALLAVFIIIGMNLLIRVLWKGFKKTSLFVFKGGKDK